MPTYGVNVVSRTTRAVKYAHRSGSTKIDFQGTNLMPGASGEAKVDSKRGAMEIEVEFTGLDKPTSFGTEYLTYVMWAISPEGRSVNMGEVLVGGNHRSKLPQQRSDRGKSDSARHGGNQRSSGCQV
jgi:hypothetical protein